MERGSRQSGNEGNGKDRRRRLSERRRAHGQVNTGERALERRRYPGLPKQTIEKAARHGILLLHRDTRELLAAASFFTMEQAKQVDVNMLELKAVQTAIGLLVAVRARKALEVARISTNEFTRPELRTLKTKVCDSSKTGSVYVTDPRSRMNVVPRVSS